MKKCPKCGTILDDSKKTCYMCGAILNNSSPLQFGETFDNQIGATLTKNQDNVFNNLNDINHNINNLSKSNNITYSENGSTPANFVKNQLGDTRFNQYDNRTALEKIFSNDSRYSNKDDKTLNQKQINSSKNSNHNEPLQKEQPVNRPIYNSQNQPKSGRQGRISWQTKDARTKPNNIYEPPQNKENKPGINWGNNLETTQRNNAKFHLSLSFIFNTTCCILFLGAMIFLYFKYIRPNDNRDVLLGNLIFTLDKEFILKSDNDYSRLYTQGENCALRISYGPTNDVDNFVEDYFTQIQNEYSLEAGFQTQIQELKINNNIWYELSVIEFKENPAITSGFSAITKYRFVSIVYKGTYYDIRYVNLDEDNTCSAMYDKFINTLAFEKK